MKKYHIWVLLLLIVMMFLMKHYCVSSEVYVQAAEVLPTHKQTVYLHTMQYCESKGIQDIKILDSNNRYSYGVMQFQMETFLREGKNYALVSPETTPKQAEDSKLIYSISLQEKIAHRMLLKGGQKNWYNCTKKLGAYPKD